MMPLAEMPFRPALRDGIVQDAYGEEQCEPTCTTILNAVRCRTPGILRDAVKQRLKQCADGAVGNDGAYGG